MVSHPSLPLSLFYLPLSLFSHVGSLGFVAELLVPHLASFVNASGSGPPLNLSACTLVQVGMDPHLHFGPGRNGSTPALWSR